MLQAMGSSVLMAVIGKRLIRRLKAANLLGKQSGKQSGTGAAENWRTKLMVGSEAETSGIIGLTGRATLAK
jgi:hypothetical protein